MRTEYEYVIDSIGALIERHRHELKLLNAEYNNAYINGDFTHCEDTMDRSSVVYSAISKHEKAIELLVCIGNGDVI